MSILVPHTHMITRTHKKSSVRVRLTNNAEKRLREVGPLVQDAMDALALMIVDLFPKDEEKEASLQELIAHAAMLSMFMIVWLSTRSRPPSRVLKKSWR